MKCSVCGKNLGMFTKYATLSDGGVCLKCFVELGFDKNDIDKYEEYSCSTIKGGYSYFKTLQEQAHSIANGLQFAHYGEERTVNATDEEEQMFRIVCAMVDGHGWSPDQVRLVRKSDSYVAAAIGDYDIARFKFTDRAKWILFPYSQEKAPKNYIQLPDDIEQYDYLLIKALNRINSFPK